MYKQAIVVRKDVKMGSGKLAAQAAHASLGSALKTDNDLIEEWMAEGAKKVVLKICGEREMRLLATQAKKLKLPHFLVKDAGLTQLKKGTVTALAIGPALEKDVDKITGKLKLL
jgi:PTH2 family peptidyl-tRNA hydrolase